MPLFDFKCLRCGVVREELLTAAEAEDIRTRECDRCIGRMERQTGAPAFTISGYSAKNGYSSGGGPA